MPGTGTLPHPLRHRRLPGVQRCDLGRLLQHAPYAADRARAKIVAAIAEQRASVEAAVEREPFTATHQVGGETRERRFRPWYFKAAGQ